MPYVKTTRRVEPDRRVMEAAAGVPARSPAGLRGLSYDESMASLAPSRGGSGAPVQLQRGAAGPTGEGLSNDGTNVPASGQATRQVYDDHRLRLSQMEERSTHDPALDAFKQHWIAHKARYEAVAARVDLPAALIAALHWRESTGDFNTYLHQGDPLGKAAVHEPKDIPIFHEWEQAAAHALKMKSWLQTRLDLHSDSTDLAAIATYAEHYNGLGYHQLGKPSPYVYAGSDQYDRGKYVADGSYDPNHRDSQPGVVPMLGRTQELSLEDTSGLPQASPTLRRGASGPAVKLLQRLLGLPEAEQDAQFGPGTRSAVQAFQREVGQAADGVVGPDTWEALRAR